MVTCTVEKNKVSSEENADEIAVYTRWLGQDFLII